MKVRLPYQLSKRERKAMEKAIDQEILKKDHEYAAAVDAIVLLTLHDVFGFGKERLRRFWFGVQSLRKRLLDYYEMGGEDFPYLCDRELKKIGVDVDEWGLEDDTESDTDGGDRHSDRGGGGAAHCGSVGKWD